MQTDYDSNLEGLVKSLTPHWTEMRVKKSTFFGVEKSPFIVEGVVFLGEPNLLCCVEWKTWHEGGKFDYFPILLKIVDPSNYSSEEYPTFARAGGTSDLDLRLRWLFDHPSPCIIEAEQGFSDGMGPDVDVLRYYGGLELRDSSSRKALRIMGTQESDFTIELKITD